MKELKDYLYLYPKANLIAQDDDGRLFDVGSWYIDGKGNLVCDNYVLDFKDVKLVLRKLSDITEEEAIQVAKLKGMLTASNGRMICNNERLAPDVFLFLLSKQIDLFDLIEAELAIDATTLKQAEHAK